MDDERMIWTGNVMRFATHQSRSISNERSAFSAYWTRNIARPNGKRGGSTQCAATCQARVTSEWWAFQCVSLWHTSTNAALQRLLTGCCISKLTNGYKQTKNSSIARKTLLSGCWTCFWSTMTSTTAQCALCLLMATDTIEVFGCQGHRMKIAEILVKHFQFLVSIFFAVAHTRFAFMACNCRWTKSMAGRQK